MKKLIALLLGILVVVACSDDFHFFSNTTKSSLMQRKDYQLVIKTRSYFMANEELMPFMRKKSLRFTDLRYGLSRKYVYDGTVFIEIPNYSW